MHAPSGRFAVNGACKHAPYFALAREMAPLYAKVYRVSIDWLLTARGGGLLTDMGWVDEFSAIVQHGNGDKAATAHRMKLCRAVLGLTQADMAELIGTTTSNYQHIERGATYPQPPYILRLLLAHGIDHNFIYVGDWSKLPTEITTKMRAVNSG